MLADTQEVEDGCGERTVKVWIVRTEGLDRWHGVQIVIQSPRGQGIDAIDGDPAPTSLGDGKLNHDVDVDWPLQVGDDVLDPECCHTLVESYESHDIEEEV